MGPEPPLQPIEKKQSRAAVKEWHRKIGWPPVQLSKPTEHWAACGAMKNSKAHDKIELLRRKVMG